MSVQAPDVIPARPDFAIVTDEPTAEMAQAGHDRCPVILEKDQSLQWLDSGALNAEESLGRLEQEKRHVFEHRLTEAA